MKAEPENLTAQQSLDIITAMIRQAKGNARRNGFHFLLWGWVAVIANLGMYVLSVMDYPYPYIVWSITIPAWVVTLIRGYRDSRARPMRTHFDRVTMWLWLSFGIVIFTCVAFGNRINYQLNPLIIMMCAIPTFISGVLLKFMPLMLGGAAFWVFGIIGFLVPMEVQPLIGAAAVFCGYLVPGYMLGRKEHD